ncbi:hypothetical protein Tco_0588317 [Tanacetum coccineum]
MKVLATARPSVFATSDMLKKEWSRTNVPALWEWNHPAHLRESLGDNTLPSWTELGSFNAHCVADKIANVPVEWRRWWWRATEKILDALEVPSRAPDSACWRRGGDGCEELHTDNCERSVVKRCSCDVLLRLLLFEVEVASRIASVVRSITDGQFRGTEEQEQHDWIEVETLQHH